MPAPTTVPPQNDPPDQTQRRDFAKAALTGILAAMTPSDAYEAADTHKTAMRAWKYADDMIACEKGRPS